MLRIDPDYAFFKHHKDWYEEVELGIFVPTDKAPLEARECMARFSERTLQKRDFLAKHEAVRQLVEKRL